MDYTMSNLRIMDVRDPMQAEQDALASSDGENTEFEMQTEKMDRIVLHSEVPGGRTCVKGGIPSPDNLGQLCAATSCSASRARRNSRQPTSRTTPSTWATRP
eukprot:8085618-Heterocapsa_arctica.AAC.1